MTMSRLNNNALGEIAEMRFCIKAIQNKFRISRPIADKYPYDFLIENAGRVIKIQIKSTNNKRAHARATPYFEVDVTRRDRKEGKVKYTSKQIDFMCCYIHPRDRWYIIPVSALKDTRRVVCLPMDPEKKSKWDKYLEAWELLHVKEAESD